MFSLESSVEQLFLALDKSVLSYKPSLDEDKKSFSKEDIKYLKDLFETQSVIKDRQLRMIETQRDKEVKEVNILRKDKDTSNTKSEKEIKDKAEKDKEKITSSFEKDFLKKLEKTFNKNLIKEIEADEKGIAHFLKGYEPSTKEYKKPIEAPEFDKAKKEFSVKDIEYILTIMKEKHKGGLDALINPLKKIFNPDLLNTLILAYKKYGGMEGLHDFLVHYDTRKHKLETSHPDMKIPQNVEEILDPGKKILDLLAKAKTLSPNLYSGSFSEYTEKLIKLLLTYLRQTDKNKKFETLMRSELFSSSSGEHKSLFGQWKEFPKVYNLIDKIKGPITSQFDATKTELKEEDKNLEDIEKGVKKDPSSEDNAYVRAIVKLTNKRVFLKDTLDEIDLPLLSFLEEKKKTKIKDIAEEGLTKEEIENRDQYYKEIEDNKKKEKKQWEQLLKENDKKRYQLYDELLDEKEKAQIKYINLISEKEKLKKKIEEFDRKAREFRKENKDKEELNALKKVKELSEDLKTFDSKLESAQNKVTEIDDKIKEIKQRSTSKGIHVTPEQYKKEKEEEEKKDKAKKEEENKKMKDQVDKLRDNKRDEVLDKLKSPGEWAKEKERLDELEQKKMEEKKKEREEKKKDTKKSNFSLFNRIEDLSGKTANPIVRAELEDILGMLKTVI